MGGATTQPPPSQQDPSCPTEPLTKQTSPLSEYEAILTGVVALAQLFATCVEAFGLITPNHKWEREEQLLLTRLGLQQARLLIWGDVVGITSPPATVTDRAVPKHPSAAYPDLKEPTFFGPRDARLEEMESRQQVEKALSALVDRTSSATREEMMEQFGLRPPKKGGVEYASPVDMNRLEAFRERYELLKEVAESYAHLNVRRNRSLMSSTSWQMADTEKFDAYLALTKEKIDFLIQLFGVKERVDRAMCMDIKALGWHLTADKARVALDVSKLKLIKELSATEYPEYIPATETALVNIERERKENVGVYNPYAEAGPGAFMAHVQAKPAKAVKGPRVSISPANGGMANGNAKQQHKRGGLFGGLLKSFGKKSRDSTHATSARSKSVSAASPAVQDEDHTDPERALSDVGPLRSGSEDSTHLARTRSKSVGGDPHDLSLFPTQQHEQPPSSMDDLDSGAPVERFRSKSIGDVLEIRPEYGDDEEEVRTRLERLVTQQQEDDGGGGGAGGECGLKKSESAISRHDQYHGLGRQGTKGQ